MSGRSGVICAQRGSDANTSAAAWAGEPTVTVVPVGTGDGTGVISGAELCVGRAVVAVGMGELAGVPHPTRISATTVDAKKIDRLDEFMTRPTLPSRFRFREISLHASLWHSARHGDAALARQA
jgi:hypothetical protein